ncbi:hypothetical protein [Thioflexithrix psekupsensis]|uniref:DUF4845 domain-containing protein n=1 Tax=Thioflexithrix psekupsensis TaxID=1570016 RepID=A0A251X755_9GAMM|nr:hypothetical protein [Thioflexithrix psekupsensis]OUD13775.1 hypothetical protein TPSD3_05330 [Thioflexithrix psekupsensis]
MQKTAINKRKQHGMSGTGLMTLLGILAFVLWIFFTAFPLVMENMRLNKAMDFLQKELANNKTERNAAGIQRILSNTLSIEGSTVKLHEKETFNRLITISRNPSFSVTMRYNQEAHLASDFWLTVKFDKTIEVSD